jgi:protein required for attachment to host cells
VTRHATEPGDGPVSGSRTFCVVVADASRARVLVLEPDRETGDAAASELVEVAEITNPLVRARSAAGRSQERRELRHEIERHFAAEIAAEAAAVWACYPPCELILVAGPAMLAVLRLAIRARTGGAPGGIDPSGIHELARDRVKLSGPRLRDELAGAGLVPARGAVHRSSLAGWP